jgi:predicted DNA-binding transcriptional regulator YafY
MNDQFHIRFARLLGILERFQSGPRYNVRDLADEFQVHRRTIFRDIRFLREVGFYISVDEQTKNYRCTGGAGFVAIPRFSSDELETLLLAAEMSPVKKTDLFKEPLNNAICRLLNKLNVSQKTSLNKTLGLFHLQLDKDFLPPNETLFRAIRQAASDGRALRVRYLCNGKAVWEEIVPREIVFCDDNWFVGIQRGTGGKARRIKMNDILTCDSWPGTGGENHQVLTPRMTQRGS